MAQSADLIRKLHSSGRQFVMAMTGGGSGAISQWLSVPGGSRSLLEAIVPYSEAALKQWLQKSPEQHCSRDTALMMATVAWYRATQLGAATSFAIGLACTAALASDRPKRGAHRCWIATQSSTQTRVYALELTKGARSRAKEEDVVADLMLMAAMESAGHSSARLPELLGDEAIESRVITAPELIRSVWERELSCCWSLPDGSLIESLPAPPSIV